MKFWIVMSISVLLSACSSAESDAKKAVSDSLKDPSSAKFGEFTLVNDKACLTVNARNGFGGYTGDQQALLLKAENTWLVVTIEKNATHNECVKVISKSSS